MMRWKHMMVGLALTVAGVAGCKQQCFLSECDYEHYRQISLAPKPLDCDPRASIEPATPASPPPSTVLDPDRKPRYLSLAEAIAIALEQGRVGDQDPTGTTLTSLINIGIPAATDSIRVLALDPAISATDIEASLAKFDAQFISTISWTTTDEPLNGLNEFNVGNSAQFQTSLLKPLPTGGVAGITFSTQYQRLLNPPIAGILNPAYTPRLQFQFEQPLLQGYGVEINQLRSTHPGSVLTPFPTGGRVPGILITRVRFDETRAEFERRVHLMLRNVELAYWNLYDAYWTLYSREQALRQAYEAWKINKARYEAGRIPVQDFAQTRQQYELFRGQRLQQLGSGTANDGVLERERFLRYLLGMPVDDGTRLVPIDAPTLTPYQPDWNTGVQEALALRPELVLARNDLKLQQLNVINVKNLLLPDLRFLSTYAPNGIGTSLDGTVENAFRSLASDKFVDWTVGLRLNYTLGYRDAYAQLRTARLDLARSYGVLREQEEKAQMALAVDYRHLFEYYALIQIQRSQREAAAVQLQARFKEYQAGRGTLDILLESQRVWADALRMEFDAITQYNNAIISYEFSKGTIMQFDNVVISEGPLPHCAQMRAVEHERERSRAIVLRERANPLAYMHCDGGNGGFDIPQLPANEAPNLPSAFDGRPPVPEITEPLPEPKKLNSPSSLPEPKKLSSPSPKLDSSNKAVLPPIAPSGGVPGIIIRSEPAAAAGSHSALSPVPAGSLAMPSAAKPGNSSKADGLQKPSADGVPGVILFASPPQPSAAAVTDKSPAGTAMSLPPPWPDAESGCLNSTSYSPLGSPGSPKRP